MSRHSENLIDVPHQEPERRLRETREALWAGATVLYEAALEYDGVMVLADILERGRRGWNLIEVKSSTSVSCACRLESRRGCGGRRLESARGVTSR